MPPKPKNTKEEIIAAALEVIRAAGPEGLTARSLGKQLGSAPSTLFTHYSSMEEIAADALAAARALYNGRVTRGLSLTPPFKGFAMEFVRFSAEEPNLFALLFMRPHGECRPEDFISAAGRDEEILAAISDAFCISHDTAVALYRGLNTYAYGIGCMQANGVCRYTDEEVAHALGTACRGMLMSVTAPADSRTDVIPGTDVSLPGTPGEYFNA